jgi:hypothetical protein
VSTAYPQTGRGNPSGPLIGGYANFLVTFDANGSREFALPFDCRAMTVSHSAQTHSSGTSAVNNTTDVNSIKAAGALPTQGTSALIDGATLTNRDLSRSEIITMIVGGTATDAVINLTVWIRDHAVADQDND